jgi:hypothetical protein
MIQESAANLDEADEILKLKIHPKRTRSIPPWLGGVVSG